MMRNRLVLTALLLLCACEPAVKPDILQWDRIAYDDISGWQKDAIEEALPAFVRSCKATYNPRSAAAAELVDESALSLACNQAERTSLTEARTFFETHFEPYQLTTPAREEGMLTGYYVPLIAGSMKPDVRYRWPVYGVPPDLEDRRPHDSRAEIDAGALTNKAPIELWVDDPIMLFFMQIQGSGRAQLPDGSVVTLQYAGQNGHPYTPIGRVLVERGELTSEEVSLQSIRQWLKDHPAQAQEVMQQNESYVFFKRNPSSDMPKGGQGISLTAERSLAVDTTQIPYGLPVFLDAETGHGDDSSHAGIQQLVITQDTGGAIKGPLRGDLFFGAGADAESHAGSLKHPAEWVLLVPKRPDNL